MTTDNHLTDDTELQQVNIETAQITWRELQRFFAAGQVIQVENGLDLVDVALQFQKDNSNKVQQWMDCNQVGKVSDAQALSWYDTDAAVWAVVVKPWVLVQSR